MNQTIEFYMKMVETLLLSGIVFFIMMKLQKRKQKMAEHQRNLTFKSLGMSDEVIELKEESDLKNESDIEVKDICRDEVVLNKVVKRKKAAPKKKKSKKKRVSK